MEAYKQQAEELEKTGMPDREISEVINYIEGKLRNNLVEAPSRQEDYAKESNTEHNKADKQNPIDNLMYLLSGTEQTNKYHNKRNPVEDLINLFNQDINENQPDGIYDILEVLKLVK